MKQAQNDPLIWLNRPICWFRDIWRTVKSGMNVSGCDFIQSEVHERCRVEVLRCETCGKVSIAWSK